jgi:HAD superfamily hydrolase (TIGR01509 family)
MIEQNHAMIALLSSLSKHYKTALATTAKKQNGQGVLEYFGLTELFDFMVFADDVRKLKPEPECYQKIANHFGIKPEECIIFEDSSKGFAAAETFGAHVCKVMR